MYQMGRDENELKTKSRSHFCFVFSLKGPSTLPDAQGTTAMQELKSQK